MTLKKFNKFRMNENNSDIDSKILSIFSKYYKKDVKSTDTLGDIGINASDVVDLVEISIIIEEELNIDVDSCTEFDNLFKPLENLSNLTVQDVINTLK
jgi:hypothetical protein